MCSTFAHRALRPVTDSTAFLNLCAHELPAQLGAKPKAVFAALRLGVSGQSVTPGLFESLWVLGRHEAGG